MATHILAAPSEGLNIFARISAALTAFFAEVVAVSVKNGDIEPYGL